MPAADYSIIFTDGHVVRRVVNWPAAPSADQLRKVVGGYLNGRGVEHMTVIHEGRRKDLFTSIPSPLDPQPINAAATEIYASAWLERHPSADPDDVPPLRGIAVLFHRKVW